MVVALPALSALFSENIVADVDVDPAAFQPQKLHLQAPRPFVRLIHFEGFEGLFVVALHAVAVALHEVLNCRDKANCPFLGSRVLEVVIGHMRASLTSIRTLGYATFRVLTKPLVRMRIVYFIETAEAGGAEQIVVTLADAFRRRGHEVSVVTLNAGWLTDELERAGLSYSKIISERSYDLTLPFRLAARCRDLKAQVLHSHLLDSNFYGAFAARIGGLRHVATDHGDIHLPNKKRLLKFKLRSISMLGSRFTAVSNFTANKLIDFGVRPRLVSCVYNPIDAIERTDDDRGRLRSEFGIAPDAWVWIHIAMMTPVKDQLTIIRALARCPKDHFLLLAGDGPLRDALEAEAEKCGVAEQVRFLGFRSDVPRLLSAADGFVLASLSESMPMSLLEAASAGLLPVSTAVGGVPEVITPDRGYLFSPGDYNSLSELMAAAAADRQKSAQLAANASAYVREAFGIERILDKYEALYSQ